MYVYINTFIYIYKYIICNYMIICNYIIICNNIHIIYINILWLPCNIYICIYLTYIYIIYIYNIYIYNIYMYYIYIYIYYIYICLTFFYAASSWDYTMYFYKFLSSGNNCLLIVSNKSIGNFLQRAYPTVSLVALSKYLIAVAII